MNTEIRLLLKRLFLKENYIIGKLYIDGPYFCDTLERPWKDNEPNISCIPKGSYIVRMIPSEKFQRFMPRLIDVPDRTDILIHPANKVEELQGCIAVGKNKVVGGLIESRFYSNMLNNLLHESDNITIEIV